MIVVEEERERLNLLRLHLLAWLLLVSDKVGKETVNVSSSVQRGGGGPK